MGRYKRLAWTVLISSAALVIAAAANASSPSSSVSDTVSSQEVVAEDPVDAESPEVTTTPAPNDEGHEAGEEAGEESDDSQGRPENHGYYVSKVAKCAPRGPEHGKYVSEMARTHENEAQKAEELCAKAAGSQIGEEAQEPDDEAAHEVEADQSEKSSQARDGHEKGGSGKEKGKSATEKGKDKKK